MPPATADPGLTGEGSGFGYAATRWLQSHPTDFRGDGKTHVQTFEVNTTEPIPPEFGGGTVGYGQLDRGQGYVAVLPDDFQRRRPDRRHELPGREVTVEANSAASSALPAIPGKW